MDSEHSPTSTATAPDDMASYDTRTDYTSTNTSPGRAAEDEWYDSKTPQPEQEPHFQYNQAEVSPVLQADFSYSHSFKEHATSVRKSLVLSDSLASVALNDHAQPQGEHQTQLAMTNSPSFSALANILERKEAKFKKSTPIIEESSSYHPSPLSTEQTQKELEHSPNLIEFGDEDTPRQQAQAGTFASRFNSTYNTQENDIFKTPDVPQSQRFPHQEYTSMLTTVESSPTPVTGAQVADSSEEEDPSPPQPLPKSPAKNKKSPLLSQQYNQRSASMPVVVDKKETKEKRRSFMNFFKSKRSVSSSNVPKKSTSFSIPSPSPQEQSSPSIKQLKGSKSFTLPKSSYNAQAQAAITRPQQAQRSASSTSLFSAFKRKKSQTFTQENTPPPQQQQQPVINIQPPQQPEEDDDDQDDTFSISSDEFNEDFNNLNTTSYEKQQVSSIPPSSTIPSSPIQNKRLSQISQGSKRHSQISQGEIIFPKNLSAQEVESIVSLERNRSQSRHSMSSRRQSMVSARNYVEQSIPHQPSFDSISGTSIQLSPGKLNSVETSPQYRGGDYLSFDDENDQQDALFDVEEFSHRLEFDTIADNYTPEPEDMSSQFAEFADYIDFGDGLELDLGFDDDPIESPLQQPALFNSPQVEESEEEEYPLTPDLSFKQPSPLSSPFLQQSAFVPSLQRPVSMSFRGLKAPAFNTLHNSNSIESFQSSQHSMSSLRSKTLSTSSSQPKKSHNRRVMFSSKIVVFDVNAADEYDRTPDVATCNQLTPQLAMRIKAELNELKSEMEIHEDSRCYIHFL